MYARAVWLRKSLTLVAVVLGAAACNTASASVDGSDLLGVFDAKTAAPTATAAAKAKGSSSAAPSAAPLVERDPGDPGCLAVRGKPEPLIRHTMGRPACRAAEILEWRDPSGAPRYACHYTPTETAKRGAIPLIVYFHDATLALDDPTSLPKMTSLRLKMESSDLTSDPKRIGFTMLAVQGRALGKGVMSGARFDTDYIATDNLDRVTVDAFIDTLIARGVVDPKRIYTMGMGTGAEMAATYAMMRPDRVAAYVAYAPAAPSADWQCPGPPPPGMVMYRACDTVTTCDSIEQWLRSQDRLGAQTSPLRLGEDNKEETNCAVKNKCSKKKGTMHHLRWPKGREKQMLQFLAGHALR